jgi:hypothetical protein
MTDMSWQSYQTVAHGLVAVLGVKFESENQPKTQRISFEHPRRLPRILLPFRFQYISEVDQNNLANYYRNGDVVPIILHNESKGHENCHPERIAARTLRQYFDKRLAPPQATCIPTGHITLLKMVEALMVHISPMSDVRCWSGEGVILSRDEQGCECIYSGGWTEYGNRSGQGCLYRIGHTTTDFVFSKQWSEKGEGWMECSVGSFPNKKPVDWDLVCEFDVRKQYPRSINSLKNVTIGQDVRPVVDPFKGVGAR